MASDSSDILERLSALEAKVARLYEHLGVAGPLTDDSERLTYATEREGPATDLPPDVVDLVQQGHQIQAIKVYRELTGLGLKEAKKAIDRITKTG